MIKPTVWLALLALYPVGIQGQQTTPPTNAYAWSDSLPASWAYGSQVTVYVDSNAFLAGSQLEAAAEQGFVNDQNAYAATNNVTYTFVSVSTTPTLSNNQAFLTQKDYGDGSTTLGEDDPGGYFNSVTDSNIITSTTVYIASAVIADVSQTGNYSVITEDTSHEESHNNDLGDCPACAANSTIMSYQNVTVDDGHYVTQITRPTTNDITVVQQASTDACNNDPCSCNPSGPGCGCEDECDPACYDYDPAACGGDGGGECLIGSTCYGSDDCDPGTDPSCDEDDTAINSSPLSLYATGSAAISLAIVLPFMFTRRKRDGERS
jgi:hypothetical protein